MSSIKYFISNYRVLLLFISIISIANASKWTYKADILTSKQEKNISIRELVGNVSIEKDSILLTTDRAILFQNTDQLELFGDVTMIFEDDTLSCDTLYYYNNDYIVASGNIHLFNQRESINSDSLFFWPKNDSALASGDVIIKNESSTMTSNRFRYWLNDNRYSFMASEDVALFMETDTVRGNYLNYFDSKNQMEILENASITREFQRLVGDSILIDIEGTLVNQVTIKGNPEIFNTIKIKSNNQIAAKKYVDIMNGKLINLFYNNNQLQKTNITGMATSLYHIINDDIIDGINEVTGDNIYISFVDNQISSMKVSGGSVGFFSPDENNSDLEGIIEYEADSIFYDLELEKNHFYDGAIIRYQDTELSADHIKVDWLTNKLSSYTIDGNEPQVKSGSNANPMVGDTLLYDLANKKGTIVKGSTEINNAYYHGDEIVSDEQKSIYSSNGIYTSCDLDEPHYYLFSNKMKITPDKHIVARPVVLHIQNLPVFAIPFAILPNKGGERQSGWIMPSFARYKNTGRHIQNLGYYFVINDYADIKFLMNFQDMSGIKLNSSMRYKKRYKYDGSITSNIIRDLNSSTDDINDIITNNITQSWNLKWIHRQTIDPSQSLNINYNYVSVNDFYQQDQIGYNTDTRLNQYQLSSLNYRKRWSESNNSLIFSISDSYDLLSEEDIPDNFPSNNFFRTHTIPNISFSHGSRLLFGNGPKWYNSIYYSLNSDFKIINKIGSIWQNSSDMPRDTISHANGVNHKFSLTTALKALKWFNVTPKLYFHESWILGYKIPEKNSAGNFIEGSYEDQPNSFKRRLTYDFSVGINTKLYGIIPINILSLNSIRHIFTPSLSYSYRPDFSSNSMFGMDIDYISTDVDGDMYDYFEDGLVPSTSHDKRESYSIKLNNDFHGKIQQKDKTFKKIHLLNWNTLISYNPTYDEFQWSYISSSFKTNLLNKINFDVNTKHDLYNILGGNRINIISNKPRLVNLSSAMQFSLNGKKITGFKNEIDSDSVGYNSNYSFPIISDESIWDASFSFRGSLSENFEDEIQSWDKDFWLNSKLNLNITKKWAASYSVRFDLVDSEILSHDFIIKRPLHCWEFNFKWYPGIGPDNLGNGFQLLIRVKNPDLQDIRLRHTEGNMVGF